MPIGFTKCSSIPAWLRRDAHLFVTPSGNRDERGLRECRLLADFAREFMAVHAGQSEIEKYDRGLELFDALKRAESIVCHERIGAQHLDGDPHCFARRFIVVHDQHAFVHEHLRRFQRTLRIFP